jgi:hypothetical protein
MPAWKQGPTCFRALGAVTLFRTDYAVVPRLCWIPSLLVVEYHLRHQQRHQQHSTRRPPAGSALGLANWSCIRHRDALDALDANPASA